MLLLLSLLAVTTLVVTAQTPAPARRPATQAAATLAITVTDARGATLSGIGVELTGPVERNGETDDDGSLRFINLRPGTYRVRFSGDEVITLEKEIFVRAGQAAEVDVALNPSPVTSEEPDAPLPAPAPAAPPPAAVGPAGQPKTLSIVSLVEKEFIGRQPRRETRLGCTGNARATMIQLNEPQPERLYESAESMYYVVAGEGTIRLNGRETPIVNGSFAIVPRGTSHGFVRRGNRPLILIAVLSGEPCETGL
jgi:mannose-6-phosphate isomerase-like protein (cupin superfamily)